MLTSDIPENREVVEGTGFMFRRGSTTDLADRLRFLIANPAVREAAGSMARRRIEERYQWHRIATDIETAYFEIMGWQQVATGFKKPNARAATASASGSTELRAG